MIPRSAAGRFAWAVFALMLTAYLLTMNRTIGFDDRGELAAAAATFGVPHPTGYPTLMLIGGALTHLVPLRPILVLNLLTAVFTAAGAAVLVLLFDRVLATIGEASARRPEDTPSPQAPGWPEPRVRAAIAALAAVFVATTMTWWQQATAFEVYGLHTLFMGLIVLLFMRWLDAVSPDAPASPASARRAGWAFAAAVGLSLTNHLTTVLLAPGLVAAAILRLGAGRQFWRRILPLAPVFVIALLPYAWLPLRSSMNPPLDWGNPDTLERFWRHVTGAQYRGLMFTDPVAMALQARYLTWRLPLDFAWVGLIVAGLGVLVLVRRAAWLGIVTLAAVTAGIVFAIGYQIQDIDSYLLTIVFGLGVAFTAGLVRIHERFGARVALVVGAGLVITNGALHLRDCNERGHRLAEQFARDALGPLPANAVLVTGMYDLIHSGGLYLQEVEGFRRDVLIVSPMRAHSGIYLDELARRVPDLVSRSQAAFDRYRATLRYVALGRLPATSHPEAERREFLDTFVAGCMEDRPVFSTGGLPEVRRTWKRVPWRLALWLRPDSAYVPEPPSGWSFTPWRGRIDMFDARACQAYAEARIERARYEAEHGRVDEAERLVRSAVAFDPHVRLDRVGPLPLGCDKIVLMTARFFHELRTRDPRLDIVVAASAERR